MRIWTVVICCAILAVALEADAAKKKKKKVKKNAKKAKTTTTTTTTTTTIRTPSVSAISYNIPFTDKPLTVIQPGRRRRGAPLLSEENVSSSESSSYSSSEEVDESESAFLEEHDQGSRMASADQNPLSRLIRETSVVQVSPVTTFESYSLRPTGQSIPTFWKTLVGPLNYSSNDTKLPEVVMYRIPPDDDMASP